MNCTFRISTALFVLQSKGSLYTVFTRNSSLFALRPVPAAPHPYDEHDRSGPHPASFDPAHVPPYGTPRQDVRGEYRNSVRPPFGSFLLFPSARRRRTPIRLTPQVCRPDCFHSYPPRWRYLRCTPNGTRRHDTHHREIQRGDFQKPLQIVVL